MSISPKICPQHKDRPAVLVRAVTCLPYPYPHNSHILYCLPSHLLLSNDSQGDL